MPLELEIRERFRRYSLGRNERRRLVERLRGALRNDKNVLLAVLYGSFPSGRPFRDIDVAVYVAGEDPLNAKLRLDAELSARLGYPVDVRVLNEAPYWFTLEVVKTGELLFEKTPNLYIVLWKKALEEKARFTRRAKEDDTISNPHDGT